MSAGSGKLNVLSIFLIASVAVFHVEAHTSCSPMHNIPSLCVPIMECKYMKQMLRTRPDHIPEYVEQMRCGSLNGTMYACCMETYVTRKGLAAPPPSKFGNRITRSTTTPAITTSAGMKSDSDIDRGLEILQSTKCGNANADRVANGEDANLGEFPWMVLLVYDDGLEPMLACGGSLITDQYVLTAAHCIRMNRRLTRVRLGEHDTKTNPDCVGRRKKRKCAPDIVEIDVEEALYHHDYSRVQFSNDIGLIRMARKATIDPYVSPVCLPITPASQNAAVPKMQIAGWGRIETGLVASVLQKARVEIKENSYCQSIHRLITLTSAQLCVGGDNNTATCMGDSGGPLFFPVQYRRGTRSVQYGVVGSGSSICGTTFPDVFARTLAHLNWIAGNLRP